MWLTRPRTVFQFSLKELLCPRAPSHSSWHFQEHAAQAPKGPAVETSLRWTATRQEIRSSRIPALVRFRLPVWVKCRKDMGGSQKIIGEVESHSVKNETGPYRKHVEELSWQILYDETEWRVLWKTEAWEIMKSKVDACCTYDCLSDPCCLCLRPFPKLSSESPRDAREPALSLWQAMSLQRVQRQACTDQEEWHWGNATSHPREAAGLFYICRICGVC